MTTKNMTVVANNQVARRGGDGQRSNPSWKILKLLYAATVGIQLGLLFEASQAENKPSMPCKERN